MLLARMHVVAVAMMIHRYIGLCTPQAHLLAFLWAGRQTVLATMCPVEAGPTVMVNPLLSTPSVAGLYMDCASNREMKAMIILWGESCNNKRTAFKFVRLITQSC